MKSYNILILILPILIIVIIGCPAPPETEHPPEIEIDISIEVIDTWATSSILRLTVDDSTEYWNIKIKRDSIIVIDQFLSGQDTIFIDGDLSPLTSYTYQAYVFHENGNIDSSDLKTTTTIDSVSSEFSWTIEEFPAFSSTLLGVTIIDKNSVWVIGRIKELDPDSSYDGTGHERFNGSHWDGNTWTHHHIGDSDFMGAVFSLSENDVWAATYNYIYHWDGAMWHEFSLEDFGVNIGNKHITPIWGPASTDMYFGGDSGRVAHYDGSTFTQIKTGVNGNVVDITGTSDGEKVILVCRPHLTSFSDEFKILRKDSSIDDWEELFLPSPPENMDYYNYPYSASVFGNKLYTFSRNGLATVDLSTGESYLTYSDATWLGGGRYLTVKAIAENEVFISSWHLDYAFFNGANLQYNDNLDIGWYVLAEWPHQADYRDDTAIMIKMYHGSEIAWGRRE